MFKNTKNMLVSIGLLLGFVACGGSSSSSETKNTSIENIEDAKKGFSSYTAYEAIDISGDNRGTDGLIKKIQNVKNFKNIQADIGIYKYANKLLRLEKTEGGQCKDGGTVTSYTSDDNKEYKLTFKDCKAGSIFYDGELHIVNREDNMDINFKDFNHHNVGGKVYTNVNVNIKAIDNEFLLYIDGVTKSTSTSGEISSSKLDNFRIRFGKLDNRLWQTINGRVTLDTKCLKGTYDYETVEKMFVKNRQGTLYSGILKINNATYTFEDPYVTVEMGKGSETLLQSELKSKTSTTCKL